MPFDMILNLSESRLIPSRQSLKTWDVKSLNELTYLYFLALRVLLEDDATKHWAQHYCHRTMRSSDFDTWRTDGNDLYVLLYAVSNDEHNAKSSVSPSLIRDWLHHASHPKLDSKTQPLFNRLDAMFRIDDSNLKMSRRLIMHWRETDQRERQTLIDQLIQRIKSLGAKRSEILDHLKSLSHEYKQISETASAGSTGAASVATVVGGLGAGFDPNGHWGVYNDKKKKPAVIRRVSEKPT